MTVSLIIGILVLAITNINSQKEFDSICKPGTCSSSNMTSPDVQKFCSNQTIYSRCCLSKSNNTYEIIGIDYSKCSLQNLNIHTNLSREIREKIEIFDLRGNNLTDCTNDSYEGFMKLEELYLPNECECPGSNDSWIHFENNTCLNQINICNSTFPNIECTVNSNCVPNGPGNFLCDCKQNYHGYKCLNQGEFPVLWFSGGLSVSTVLLCAFLWHFQRRHVKSD